MLTSLAPSPIDKVVLRGKRFLTNMTIYAFWAGETLQARTTSTCSAPFRNNSVSSSFILTVIRDAPAIIMACFFFGSLSLVAVMIWLIFVSSYCRASRSWFSIMCYTIWCGWSKRPAETPILIAVSTLSPVSTQTLIPAFFMNRIVSATSSWSLSSIAVEPINSRLTSISSSTLATSSSRSYKDNLAYFTFAFH